MGVTHNRVQRGVNQILTSENVRGIAEQIQSLVGKPLFIKKTLVSGFVERSTQMEHEFMRDVELILNTSEDGKTKDWLVVLPLYDDELGPFANMVFSTSQRVTFEWLHPEVLVIRVNPDDGFDFTEMIIAV